ncbi:DEAD/DEAH box helicase [Paenibacillus aurantius]|uniref:DEAD/DEAH box helicase n=1 Tax=Paenibacillus aurantius TaxID=2918900 RepID=A0AA96LEH7_9BACL|nr:DEAD/DEAH box helicase [Paenibacillus aurantius]WNQ12322.1 DEAD/DEAH box helicase [Paenibacillus aurantius]
MNISLTTLTVEVEITAHGDVLLGGSLPDGALLLGTALKHRLFARHKESFYGTGLEVLEADGVEFVHLPAEQVIPYFAGPGLLRHIEWSWNAKGAALLAKAPLLAKCLEEKRFVPDFTAFREGRLEWTWDEASWSPEERAEWEAAGRPGPSEGAPMAGESGKANRPVPETVPAEDRLGPGAVDAVRLAEAAGEVDGPGMPDPVPPEEAGFGKGLKAAFSAAVARRYYAEEPARADLRRDYPLLFAGDAAAAAAGLDAESWLRTVGWKPDTAPFRPVLQLSEPDEDRLDWRLQLILQDKRNEAGLTPVRLAADGRAHGVWPGGWSAHVAERSTGWLERLRAVLPAGLLAGGEDVLGRPLGEEDAWAFLTEESTRLLEAGWPVLLPSWWEDASKKKPRLKAKVAESAGSPSGGSLFGLDAILEYDWRIAIGEAELTEAEFEELVAQNKRLVRFRGRWVALDPALLKQIRQMMAGMDREQGLSFQDVLQLHLLGQAGEEDGGAAEEDGRVALQVELNEHLEKLIRGLGQPSELPGLAVPAGLRAELRSYQRDGFSWLANLRRFGLGACLADDMGLGKTVQLIAYLLHVQETAKCGGTGVPSLILCPTSVLGNWQREIARFGPSLRVLLHYGPRRLSGEAFEAGARQADVVLTSYATAALDQELLQGFTWETIALDEAQNIKNAQTRQSAAVRLFPARHRIALTGTPIENRLSELWSIFDFLSPGYLGSQKAFGIRFAGPIEKERDEKRTAQLQRLIQPFLLRRKKKDPSIQLDLPDKNEMKTYVPLTAEQAALYEQTVNDLMERIQKLEGIERKGAILATLTYLKRVCDHPVLMTKEAVPGLTPEARGTLDRNALIARSSKLERLLAMVKELRESDERCLIFTQYLGMGHLLQLILSQELEEPVLYLNGSTSKTARDRMIDRFQSSSLPPGEQPNVFILSLKAGGVGLNLTAANHVFHFDRWWNPAVENQATDRAYRMGQKRDVQVHKFIAIGTLEERIDEMLENKQQLSDNVIATSEGWITELPTEALRELFTLRSEWVG